MAFMLKGPPRSIKDIGDLILAENDREARVYVAILLGMGLIRQVTPITRVVHGRAISVDMFEPTHLLHKRQEIT